MSLNKVLYNIDQTADVGSDEQATARHNLGIDLLVPTPAAADNGKVLKVTDAQGNIGWAAESAGSTVYFDGTDLTYSAGVGTYTPSNNCICVCTDWDGGWNFNTFVVNVPTGATNVTVILSNFSSTQDIQLLVKRDGTTLSNTTIRDGNTYVIFARGNQVSIVDWATAPELPTRSGSDNGKILKVVDAQGNLGWATESGGGSTDFVLTDEVLHDVTDTEAGNKSVHITVDTTTTFVQGMFSKLVSANALCMVQIASANQLGSEFVRAFLDVRQFTTGGGESVSEIGYVSFIKSIAETTSNCTITFPLMFLHDLSRFDFELVFPSSVNIYESLRFGIKFRAFILP